MEGSRAAREEVGQRALEPERGGKGCSHEDCKGEQEGSGKLAMECGDWLAVLRGERTTAGQPGGQLPSPLVNRREQKSDSLGVNNVLLEVRPRSLLVGRDNELPSLLLDVRTDSKRVLSGSCNTKAR